MTWSLYHRRTTGISIPGYAKGMDATYVNVQASFLLVVIGAGAGGGVVLAQLKLVVGGRVVQPQGFCVFMMA